MDEITSLKTELDRQRVQIKMLMDDKAALTAERDTLRQYLDAAQRRCEELREQLTLAESVRAAQVAGLTQGLEKAQEVLREYIDAADACVSGDDDVSAMLRFGEADKAARAALKGGGS